MSSITVWKDQGLSEGERASIVRALADFIETFPEIRFLEPADCASTNSVVTFLRSGQTDLDNAAINPEIVCRHLFQGRQADGENPSDEDQRNDQSDQRWRNGLVVTPREFVGENKERAIYFDTNNQFAVVSVANFRPGAYSGLYGTTPLGHLLMVEEVIVYGLGRLLGAPGPQRTFNNGTDCSEGWCCMANNSGQPSAVWGFNASYRHTSRVNGGYFCPSCEAIIRSYT